MNGIETENELEARLFAAVERGIRELPEPARLLVRLFWEETRRLSRMRDERRARNERMIYDLGGRCDRLEAQVRGLAQRR